MLNLGGMFASTCNIACYIHIHNMRIFVCLPKCAVRTYVNQFVICGKHVCFNTGICDGKNCNEASPLTKLQIDEISPIRTPFIVLVNCCSVSSDL